MRQVFDQLLKFLQQGIAAIFHFIELIWTWSVDQISKLFAVPWQDWPLLKQLILIVILAAVIWALYRVGLELLEAGARILAAFAALLAVLVQTLPHVFLAGVIALGGVWLINHLDNSSLVLRKPAWMQASDQPAAPVERTPATAQEK
jgi:ABC-type proline/glycine betaine transport system permease subunit